ncbi:hypothetical protein VNO80_31539 [Phaseolus coccineus]|uniref:Pentatricopeptide repeat-containing protein n=1 Tax=Phaseolus coccineus TaxID=3886 RepID=A0AAN9L3W9_PHACN
MVPLLVLHPCNAPVFCPVVSSSFLHVGEQIHCQAILSGFITHPTVLTSLIHMYSSCANVSSARKLFDAATFKHVSLWNAMLEVNPSPHQAITLFRTMLLHNVQPDKIAILALLSACADLGALQLGVWIHNYFEKHKLPKILSLYNSLIDMYAKSGDISKARQEALELFSCMEKAGVKPNEVTFITILSACSHVGLVELGRHYFTCMRSKYGIEPEIEHYGCMVDLLGRAVWGSLLSASNRYGDFALAKEALPHLSVTESHNCGNYSLLSNTYSALGRWKEAGMVRKVMRDKRMEKASRIPAQTESSDMLSVIQWPVQRLSVTAYIVHWSVILTEMHFDLFYATHLERYDVVSEHIQRDSEIAKFGVYVTVPIILMYTFANNPGNLRKFMGNGLCNRNTVQFSQEIGSSNAGTTMCILLNGGSFDNFIQMEKISKRKSQSNHWVNNEWDWLDPTVTHIGKFSADASKKKKISITLAHRLPIPPTKQPGVHKQNKHYAKK